MRYLKLKKVIINASSEVLDDYYKEIKDLFYDSWNSRIEIPEDEFLKMDSYIFPNSEFAESYEDEREYDSYTYTYEFPCGDDPNNDKITYIFEIIEENDGEEE